MWKKWGLMERLFVSAERTEHGTVSRVRRWQVCSHARCTCLPLKSRDIKKIMRSVGRRRRLSLTLSRVRDGLCEPLWFALTRDKIRQIRSDWCLSLLLYAIFRLSSFLFFSVLKQLGWDDMGWCLKPTVYRPSSLSWRHISVAKCSNSFPFLLPRGRFCFSIFITFIITCLVWVLVTAAVRQSVFSELVHTYTHAPTVC